MRTVAAGDPLLAALDVAYRADVPVMLHGTHGVGKSELIAAYAQRRGLGLLIRDLSLMEPPDLIGLPELVGGRTLFRPPASLPTEGNGVLVLEELNRAPRHMQAPALQLLTARTLNDYSLPSGWLPVAAVNDASDGYFVEELDPALTSRFVHLRVQAELGAWCAWAEGRVHPAVVRYVRTTPGALTTLPGTPRAWAQAGRLLAAAEAQGAEPDTLLALLSGILGEPLATGLVGSLRSSDGVPDPYELVANYRRWRPSVLAWVRSARLDLLSAAWEGVDRLLVDPARRPADTPMIRANLASLAGDLPGDLRARAVARLGEAPWPA